MNGNTKVVGGRGLKESQAYPDEFGRQLARLFAKHINKYDELHASQSDDEAELDSAAFIARFGEELDAGEEMSGIQQVANSLGVHLPANFLPSQV